MTLLLTLCLARAQDPHAGHDGPEAAEVTRDHEAAAPAPDEAPGRSLLRGARMRTASGTAWQPEAAPMYMVALDGGDWDLMVHAASFTLATGQAGERGDAEIVGLNSYMVSAARPVGAGQLELRAMASLEPLTVGREGYPLLLQTGETFQGEPLVDRQHPHDLVMEAAAAWRQALGAGVGLEIYAGLAGEPALGPVAFVHRASAVNDPVAPLGHHWMDSTHITYGVLTGGLFGRRGKLEGSFFNGREPDENRWDLDLRGPDSGSVRATWLPTRELALQASWGRLAGPEALRPDERVDRATASATWSHALGPDRHLDATGAWGRNSTEHGATDAALAEANLDLGAFAPFGRAAVTEKAAHDLDLAGERTWWIPSADAGLVWHFARYRAWESGLGLRANAALLPDDLVVAYGLRVPFGLSAFWQFRPKAMAHRPQAVASGAPGATPALPSDPGGR